MTTTLKPIPALLALVLAVGFCCRSCPAQDAAAAASQESTTSEEKGEKDRYAVPKEADVPKLVAFVRQLTSFRPTSALEAQLHQKRLPAPLREAATKIVKLEKDPQSDAYAMGRGILFELQIHELDPKNTKEHKKLVDGLTAYIGKRKNITGYEFALAINTAQRLEAFGNDALAASTYKAFADQFAKNSNPQIAAQAEMLRGSSRRLSLVGNTMQVKGQTVKGKDFDLKDLKGKVVLIDFWATWCGPCLAEYPNILNQYKKYHDKGFEVVGISLDQNRFRLEQYLAQKEVPWTTLHDALNPGQHQAAGYYGISSIPRMILVGRDGKVISVEARGEELVALLAKEFAKAPKADVKKSSSTDAASKSK